MIRGARLRQDQRVGNFLDDGSLMDIRDDDGGIVRKFFEAGAFKKSFDYATMRKNQMFSKGKAFIEGIDARVKFVPSFSARWLKALEITEQLNIVGLERCEGAAFVFPKVKFFESFVMFERVSPRELRGFACTDQG